MQWKKVPGNDDGGDNLGKDSNQIQGAEAVGTSENNLQGGSVATRHVSKRHREKKKKTSQTKIPEGAKTRPVQGKSENAREKGVRAT